MRRIRSSELSYLRSFVFGVEDSLVSTVGLLSGIAIAHVSGKTILLTGVVLIFVEAFSMAAGSFLSEYSAEEYVAKKEVSSNHAAIAAMVMFWSYCIAGLIPLVPYVVMSVSNALVVSIFASLISLLLLGVAGGKISHTSMMHGALRMVIIGGIAIAVGIVAGQLVGGNGY